ncbi:BTB domain-containingtranscription factor [Purpureocillium lilacinum]|uniref:BTB domain-containingtranscription factor n=1 Tax=Purpureocillium lilacinum TaxID=33203 RepID=A0A179FIZ5_PURLI|nr:BTB domain-containingtranscription factor [Purpureocillium lilacinum]
MECLLIRGTGPSATPIIWTTFQARISKMTQQPVKAEAEYIEPAMSAGKTSQTSTTQFHILELGRISFLFRARVGIADPQAVDDIAQSYIILRPTPQKTIVGGIAHEHHDDVARLLVLPKKVLPCASGDKLMAFVDQANMRYSEIKDSLGPSDYETKTLGVRHLPAATVVGEGLYAITTTGRDSHLSYLTLYPKKLEKYQRLLQLKGHGSFIICTKNPNYPGPSNARLPNQILDEFRSLRWMPTKPAHMDYVNAQLLLIYGTPALRGADNNHSRDDKKEIQETLPFRDENDLKGMQDLSMAQFDEVLANLQAQG